MQRHGNGKKIYIPIEGEIGFFNLASGEVWLNSVLKKIEQSIDGVFVDVGVNLGQSLLLHYSLDLKNTYLGFEPNPTCYSYVKKLIKKNGLKNYHLVPTGLAAESDIVKLFGNVEHASGASILENFRADKHMFNKVVQYVCVMKGDDVLAQLNLNEKIGLLKIDVEGAELDVLKGLTKTIERDKPIMIVEVLPVYSLESENGKYRKSRLDAVLKLLSEQQYLLYLILEDEAKLKRISTIEAHNKMSETNYIFVHKTNVQNFELNFGLTNIF